MTRKGESHSRLEWLETACLFGKDSQQSIYNARIGASVTQMINQFAKTVTSRRRPQLLKRARKLNGIGEVSRSMEAGIG